jgi:hypothetical protein
MVSSIVSRSSATLLLLGGLAFLFLPDAVLMTLVPGYPPAGAVVGQLVGAAWLGLGVLNWVQRAAILGGIYGRPVVLANFVAHAVGALSVARAIFGTGASSALWIVFVPIALLAVVYAALLLRGPFDSLAQVNNRPKEP